jgi:Rrf2 family protein
MRISAKGRYAIAALMQIADRKNAAEPVPLVSIAETLGLSKLFLEQVAVSLKKGGLITAVKGAKGGYQLVGDPSAITVLDVLRAVENTLFETAQNEPLENAPAVSDALSALVFAPLDKAIEDCLSAITLRDLLDYTLEHANNHFFMMYI